MAAVVCCTAVDGGCGGGACGSRLLLTVANIPVSWEGVTIGSSVIVGGGTAWSRDE